MVPTVTQHHVSSQAAPVSIPQASAFANNQPLIHGSFEANLVIHIVPLNRLSALVQILARFPVVCGLLLYCQAIISGPADLFCFLYRLNIKAQCLQRRIVLTFTSSASFKYRHCTVLLDCFVSCHVRRSFMLMLIEINYMVMKQGGGEARRCG